MLLYIQFLEISSSLGNTVILSLFFFFALSIYLALRCVWYRRTIRSLKEQNKRLRKKTVEASESNKTMQEFMLSMSREIRTPLHAVLGFAQLLSDPDMPIEREEKLKFMKHIRSNSESLNSLVGDIINIMEVRTGKLKISKVPTECNELVSKCVEIFRPRCHEGLTITFTSDLDDSLMLNTDSKRAIQIIENLLSNADKFTQQGEINVSCTDQLKPGYISVTVTDTGIGIPKDQAEKIFERFYKLDKFSAGTGLGLTISRELANMMNTELYLDTTYEGGARFIVNFPI